MVVVSKLFNDNTFNKPINKQITLQLWGKQLIDVCLKLVIRDGENAERLL